MADKSFLGTGWTFPPTFEKRVDASGVNLVSDIEDIKQSLEIILNTALGERVMQPNFGANLNELLFEGIDISLVSLIQEIITNAIRQFESRITLEDIKIDTQSQLEGLLTIEVDFIVKSINTRTNIVFPFYLNEGTDIVQ